MPSRRENLERLLAADPKDPFLRYGLAMEHVAEGKNADAARLLQELLADSPEYVAGYFHCAQALLRDGKNEDAKRILQTGVGQAQKAGDMHAAEEMQGLLGTIAES